MSSADTEPSRSMFQSERQREILNRTLNEGRVDVAELSVSFGVTTETIRRDLSELQDRGYIKRVHGGAVPRTAAVGFEPLLRVRNDRQVAEKRAIATLATEELPSNGATVIIDSGSTLSHFCEAVPPGHELTVITNSLTGAQVLAGHDSLEVVVLGGRVRANTLAMVDAQTADSVRDLVVDTLFISCDGMSVERGLSTPYRGEAALKEAMISVADRVVAMVDHSKIGNDQLMRFARWSQVDVLISDRGLDPELAERIADQGPIVRLA